jgi:hypothetical protein
MWDQGNERDAGRTRQQHRHRGALHPTGEHGRAGKTFVNEKGRSRIVLRGTRPWKEGPER